MWCAQNLLFILCAALSRVSRAEDLIRVFGYEGRAVDIGCPYPEGYEDYEKYLCRESCGHSDVLIKTTEKRKTKYSISDNNRRRIFTTTISKLDLDDAGKYWCGVTRNGNDLYTEVKLEISKDSCCSRVSELQGTEEGSVSFRCPSDPAYISNLKYFCRGTQPSTCLQEALVTSNDAHDGRVTLTDDGTATISGLTLSDSGSYLCGVQINTGWDDFTAFKLSVKDWCCVTLNNTSGVVGRSVILQCPYPAQHRNNRKFICKGNHRKACKDMMGQNRYTLREDSFGSFTVTISELKADDAGMYWCRSEADWSVGEYTKFNLTVEKEEVNAGGGEKKIDDPSKQSNTDETVLYAVLAVAALVLLILMIVLVKLCKRRRNNAKEAEVTNGNKLEALESQEVKGAADVSKLNYKALIADPMGSHEIYENCSAPEVQSQQTTSTRERVGFNFEHKAGDESEYGNITTEELYSNEPFHQTHRR